MNDSFDFHCESGVLGKGFRKICAVKPYELSNLTELFFLFFNLGFCRCQNGMLDES